MTCFLPTNSFVFLCAFLPAATLALLRQDPQSPSAPPPDVTQPAPHGRQTDDVPADLKGLLGGRLGAEAVQPALPLFTLSLLLVATPLAIFSFSSFVFDLIGGLGGGHPKHGAAQQTQLQERIDLRDGGGAHLGRGQAEVPEAGERLGRRQ